MANSEICPACMQKIRKLNPHRMDAAKVSLLDKIARLTRVHLWIKVQRDGRLIPDDERAWTVQCDDVHALRLTWFGLLERKEFRSGLYRVTPAGYAFLTGRGSVPELIYCKDGTVVKESCERVFVGNVRGVILDKPYWDNYAALQRPVDDPQALLPGW